MDFGELITEAAERAGLDAASLTHRHLASIRRSFDFTFIEIENEGARPEYRVESRLINLPAGQGAILLPEDTIDVLQCSIRGSIGGRAYDQPLGRTTREDYHALCDKNARGFPTVFWVSKSLPAELSRLIPQPTGWGMQTMGDGSFGGTGAQAVTSDSDRKLLVLWPIPSEIGASTVLIERLRETASPSAMGVDIDARRNWLDLICDGVAARIAGKYNPDREARLQGMFKGALATKMQSEDRGPVVVGFRGFGFARGRRH